MGADPRADRARIAAVLTTTASLLADALSRRTNGDVSLAGLDASAGHGHALGDRARAHGAGTATTHAHGREGGEGSHLSDAVEGHVERLELGG